MERYVINCLFSDQKKKGEDRAQQCGQWTVWDLLSMFLESITLSNKFVLELCCCLYYSVD